MEQDQGITVEISYEEMRKRKMFVGTPMFGGQNYGTYNNACINLGMMCIHKGIHVEFHALFNESLITRARNYLVDEFLRSECTHLLFVDADIGFNAQDALALMAIAGPETDYDILCAPYPKKSISWEKIKMAVDKGFADENAELLNRYVGDFVFNPTSNQKEIALDRPVEVLEGGTGFMMIQRRAFEKYADAYPELKFTPDHMRTKHFDGSRQITAFFDTVICPDTNRYLSEDYMFCQWARKIGLKVWMCPWIPLNHTGTFTFGGSLLDLAQIGASPTVDPNSIGKSHLVKR